MQPAITAPAEPQQQSLLDVPPKQPELSLPPSLPAPRNPEFTAVSFFSEAPEIYREIVRLRAEGLSKNSIARMFGCSRNLISAIDRREADSQSVEQCRTQAVANYRQIASMASERILEMLDDDMMLLKARTTIQQLAVTMGVAEEKLQLLQGHPTARVALSKGESHDDVVAYLQGLRDAWQQRAMGLGGETMANVPASGSPGCEAIPGVGQVIEGEVVEDVDTAGSAGLEV